MPTDLKAKRRFDAILMAMPREERVEYLAEMCADWDAARRLTPWPDHAGWGGMRQAKRIVDHAHRQIRRDRLERAVGQARRVAATAGARPTDTASHARPRERRPISRRAAARAPGGDDDPPPAAGDSDLNVLLQAAFAAGLSARECFEAAAILERRGEWLMGRAA